MPGSRKNTFGVETIMDSRVRNGKKEYFIKWENYPNNENTWEPESNIVHKNLVREFNLRKKKEDASSASQANGNGHEEKQKGRKRNVEYDVEDILDMRRTRGKVEYFIKWKNYPITDCTWEPEENITDKALVAKFNAKKKKVKDSDPETPLAKKKKVKDSDPETPLAKKKKVKDSDPETPLAKKKKVKDSDSETPLINKESKGRKVNQEEYDVESILDVRGTGGEAEYLIKWKNFPKAKSTWEPEANITDKALIKKFNAQKQKESASETPRTNKQTQRRKVTEEEYDVEEILDFRRSDAGKAEYFIKWKNYPMSQSTWEPEANITDKGLIEKFNVRQKSATAATGRKTRTR